MKKLFILFLLLIICLTACGSAVNVGSFKSKIYNFDEFEDAVNVTMSYFKTYEGCTMREIHYAGDNEVSKEAKLRKTAPDYIIILESTFITDSEIRDNGLEHDHEYKNYKWVLERSSRSASWEVTDHGY